MNKASKAIRAARKIPNGQNTPAKRKAVHRWNVAVKEMLRGERSCV